MPRPSKKTQRVIYLDHDIDRKLVQYCERRGRPISQAANTILGWHLMGEDDDNPFDLLIRTSEQIQQAQGRMSRELSYQMNFMTEMLALYVKQFYFYTPAVHSERRDEAIASGKQRFERFLVLLQEIMDSGEFVVEPKPDHEELSTDSAVEMGDQ